MIMSLGAQASSAAGAGRPVQAVVESLGLGDGRALCVRRWPGTSDATLVILHGLLDSSEGWSPLAEGVSCSVVAFDLPGFGYSDLPERGSVSGYARDVAEGLELLGIDRFTLVGHSLGGAVAAALAELVPDEATTLVLLAPAGFGRIARGRGGVAAGLASSRPGRNAMGAFQPGCGHRRLSHDGDERQTSGPRGGPTSDQPGGWLWSAVLERAQGQSSTPGGSGWRFIAGASTTRGRFSRCGATAIASCRPPTVTVCRPRSPRLGSTYGQAWATTRSPSALIDWSRSSRTQLDSLPLTPSRQRCERLPPVEPQRQ
jgi:pimeloyl-ACP methyl ester carboxylesterase